MQRASHFYDPRPEFDPIEPALFIDKATNVSMCNDGSSHFILHMKHIRIRSEFNSHNYTGSHFVIKLCSDLNHIRKKQCSGRVVRLNAHTMRASPPANRSAHKELVFKAQ